MSVTLKRIYDEPNEGDGYRVLVDRLWPRGLSKDKAKVDLWLKDIAPTTELRTWYGHDPKKFDDFKSRYESELSSNDALQGLRDTIKKHKVVTLLFAAHDTDLSNAKVLHGYL